MCTSRGATHASMIGLDRGEVTDKDSINQRVVLEHRAALVEELYATQPSPRVICTNC